MSRAVLEIEEQRSFLSQVSQARQRVLLIDYDGTVAPFSVDRQKAIPYTSIPELLRRIEMDCKTRLIVITGRPAHEIVSLLRMMPLPEIWGTYGLERLHGDSSRWHSDEAEVTDEAAEALAEAEVHLVDDGLHEHIEVKMAGVAVHWRGLQPSEILNVRTKAYQVFEPLSRSGALVMAEFEEGIELRLRSANKGNAVRRLLDELGRDIPVAYLGDDATDEDAFRALNGRGLTALVRPKHRFTSAQIWLRPPDQLIAFLKDWIRACGGDK